MYSQGDLEKVSVNVTKDLNKLEERILGDIVRRVEINGFSTASADWQIDRLQMLGNTEESITEALEEAMEDLDMDIDHIFDEEVYRSYMGHEKAYHLKGMTQIPFKENEPLNQLIDAVKSQTKGKCKNLTRTIGVSTRDIKGKKTRPLMPFVRDMYDQAMYDIHSGGFDYQTVLKRTVDTLARSGVRYIDYVGGKSFRLEAAVRMNVMTGFRQIQGEINKQVAKDLNTDWYEVSWHAGARPSHQEWQGRVYSYHDLVDICGYGSAEGLLGINCYHDFAPFIPGASIRVYTDEWLDKQNAKENEKTEYAGTEYTTYEALQKQREMERAMRLDREKIYLLKEGKGSEKDITDVKGHYQTLKGQYIGFSKKMDLPQQWDRINLDGLKKRIKE